MGQFDHIAKAMLASPLMAEFMEMAGSNDFSRLEKSNRSGTTFCRNSYCAASPVSTAARTALSRSRRQAERPRCE